MGKNRGLSSILGSMAVVLTLSACSAPQGDAACTAANRRATLENLIANSFTGAYDNCLTEMRRDLAALRLEGRLLEAEARRLTLEAEAAEAEHQAARQRHAELVAAQAELTQEIASLEDELDISRAELDSILEREQALRERITELEATPEGEMLAELERLEAEQQAIRAVIEALTAE